MVAQNLHCSLLNCAAFLFLGPAQCDDAPRCRATVRSTSQGFCDQGDGQLRDSSLAPRHVPPNATAGRKSGRFRSRCQVRRRAGSAGFVQALLLSARANGAQASWIHSIAPDSAAAGSGLGQPRAERPKRGKGEDSLREGSASSGVPRPLRQCLSSFAAAAFRGGRATKEFETMLWEHEVFPTQGSPLALPIHSSNDHLSLELLMYEHRSYIKGPNHVSVSVYFT